MSSRDCFVVKGAISSAANTRFKEARRGASEVGDFCRGDGARFFGFEPGAGDAGDRAPRLDEGDEACFGGGGGFVRVGTTWCLPGARPAVIDLNSPSSSVESPSSFLAGSSSTTSRDDARPRLPGNGALGALGKGAFRGC